MGHQSSTAAANHSSAASSPNPFSEPQPKRRREDCGPDGSSQYPPIYPSPNANQKPKGKAGFAVFFEKSRSTGSRAEAAFELPKQITGCEDLEKRISQLRAAIVSEASEKYTAKQIEEALRVALVVVELHDRAEQLCSSTAWSIIPIAGIFLAGVHLRFHSCGSYSFCGTHWSNTGEGLQADHLSKLEFYFNCVAGIFYGLSAVGCVRSLNSVTQWLKEWLNGPSDPLTAALGYFEVGRNKRLTDFGSSNTKNYYYQHRNGRPSVQENRVRNIVNCLREEG